MATSTVGVQTLLGAKLPIKAKYAVSRLASAIDKEIEKYQADRKQIFEDAGCVIKTSKVNVPNGEGGLKTVDQSEFTHDDPAVLAAAIADAEELSTVEVELSALPLDLAQFGDGDIEGPAFYGLEWAMKAPE